MNRMAIPRRGGRPAKAATPAAVALLMALALPLAPAGASSPGYGGAPMPEIALEQHLGRRAPMDLRFANEQGEPVALKQLAAGRPSVLVLAYYRCPMLCGLVLTGLAEALADVPLTPGEDFEVVVVSIDPRETPEAAREAKKTLLATYGRPETAAGWHLLTAAGAGTETAEGHARIRQLAEAVGFRYAYDEGSDQYAHPSGIIILAGDGTISQVLYGFEYAPAELEMALTRATSGEVGPAVRSILFGCFIYDPVTGRYGLQIVTALRVGGILTVLLLGGLIAYWLWSERHRSVHAAASAG